jgi:TolB-like protein/Tfp pilus assembly protein PilF
MSAKTETASWRSEPERWQRLKSILAEALDEESPTARAALVQRSCADDTTLFNEAVSLLAQATDDFDHCATRAKAALEQQDESETGKRIGPYVIVSELGHGGMGAVYLAARADGQFEKQVAIKLLKRGSDSDEILRRFRAERQILARLDHPNIARLLDSGTTDDGSPYFIMECVVGSPVTRFVAEHHLALRDRLALFLKICAAVEAAHHNLVIHRDLKPSNILVTEEGEPKLLDFGIAKLIAPAEIELTQTGQQRFTPISASPEQATGQAVTPASDIYALGALLYEILTEQKSHQFTSSRPSPEELARVLGEQEPVPPSAAAATHEWQRRLRGDLDSIVLRAMRKEPAERYASVEEFGSDIRRYLEGRPVRARGNSVRYRAHRFVTRNRTPIARLGVAAVALLTVAGGIAAYVVRINPRLLHAAAPAAFAPATNAVPMPDKSIAVLPFQNLSVEKENAFFADGVQDAILTDLAKIADLKVIGRASVADWTNGARRDFQQIGAQLNVANLLQGNVQRAGNRVRVSAQLIDARSGAQLWAESYDRELADVFAIQTEISKAIVNQLRARLLPSEKQEIEASPTRDIAAYGLYLQAKEIVNSYLDAPDPNASLRQAIRLLEEATRRDPAFTLAYCYTARAQSLLFALGFGNANNPRDARQALDTALRLQPDSSEVHLAFAEWYYRCFLNFAAAQKELAIARAGLPNSSPLYVLSGNVLRRQSRWSEAVAELKKAVDLDPRNPNAINFLADTQILMRDFAAAIETYQRGKKAGLDTPILAVRMAIADFSSTGQTDRLRAALAAAPSDLDVGGGETPFRILLALADHDYEAARRTLAASPRADFQDVDFSFYYPRSWYEGMIERAAGNDEAAKVAFESSLAYLEPLNGTLGAVGQMGRPRARAVVAQSYAALGLKEKAINEAVSAAKAMTISDDAYLGPLILQSLAQVYTWTGEKDRALDVINELLHKPGYLAYGFLLVDPAWDPLRGDPRFEQIVASLAPKQ